MTPAPVYDDNLRAQVIEELEKRSSAAMKAAGFKGAKVTIRLRKDVPVYLGDGTEVYPE